LGSDFSKERVKNIKNIQDTEIIGYIPEVEHRYGYYED